MTKQEIQNRINQLNRQLNSYVQERKEYNTALHNAQDLVNTINEGISSLNTSSENLKKYFTIGGTIVGSDKIQDTDSGMKDIKKQLSNTIIPAINSSIRNLTNKIHNTESEIENLKRQYANATE